MLNVVVICVDSWRADILGGSGRCRWIHAPALRDFSRQCVVFDRAFGEGMPTIQMRRGFFTGMRSYPWHHNVDGLGMSPAFLGWHRIPHSQMTLAEILLLNGYFTGLITDCYHFFKPTQNLTRGFLSWEFIRGQQGDNYRPGPFDDIDIRRFVPDGEVSDFGTHSHIVNHLLSTRDRRTEDDYFAARVFQSAIQWLRDGHGNAPYFLWIDSFSPHELWDPPPRFADAYFPNDGTLKDFIHPGVANRIQDLRPDQIERTKALYAGSCTFVDKWIGHLLETLDELRLWDDTVVCFVTDHGAELWDDGQFTKFGANHGKLHPYNTQIEWFIRHPHGARGKHLPGLVQNQDFLPTLLDMVGLPGSELLDGKSAVPLIDGTTRQTRGRIVTGWGQWAAVRDADWNCIFNPTTADGSPRLFDLLSDPLEKCNVALEHPDVVAGFRRHLEGLNGCPLPVRYKHQPDAGDYMTLSAHFKRRRVQGLPAFIPQGGDATTIPFPVSADSREVRQRRVG